MRTARWLAVALVSAAIGPTIAAGVLAIAHWRWLFGINGPIGLVTFLIALRSLPETATSQRRPNYVGALLNAATFALLISGLQALAHDSAGPLAALQLAEDVLEGRAEAGWVHRIEDGTQLRIAGDGL